MSTLKIEKLTIEIQKVFKLYPYARLKVRKDCVPILELSAFYKSPEKFIKSHLRWLKKRVEECKQRTLIFKYKKLPIFGKWFALKKEDTSRFTRNTLKKAYREGRKEISIPSFLFKNKKMFYRTIIDSYKELLKEETFILVHEYYTKARLVYPKIKPLNKIFLRASETRWGSCSTSGNINLSYRLGFIPISLIKYVIAHEVAHLAFMDHSLNFWKFTGKLYPYAKQARKLLRDWEKVRVI